jgi:hypothetical protein
MPVIDTVEMTVAQLEVKQADIRRRLDGAVTRASTGQSSGDDIAALAQEMSAVAKSIVDARAREVQERQTREREQRCDARQQFDAAIACAKEQRAKFLNLFREATLTWAEFLTASSQASEFSDGLVGAFGLLPHDQDSLRSIALDNATIFQTVADLHPFTDQHWRTGIQLTPKQLTR